MPTHSESPSSRHLHEHHAGDAKHPHFTEHQSQGILIWAFALTLGFALVEAVAGFLANSLALVSDAGHMVTDATALGLALLAQVIAKRPPSASHSFGFGRAEALAAFVNGLAMLGMILWISIEAVQRFAQPEIVQSTPVFIVAAIGLVLNLIVAWVLSHDKHNLNTKAALVHVLGDLLGSVATLVAGAVIYVTGWMQIDPLLSIFISLLILKSTLAVLRESYHFLMEGVPHHIDYLQVGTDLGQVKGVLSVHDLHVWEMAPGQPALTGHIEVTDLQAWPTILVAVKAMLLQRHGIDHVTLQAELPEMAEDPCCCGRQRLNKLPQ